MMLLNVVFYSKIVCSVYVKYLLPNVDLAWLRRYTRGNRLVRAQVATKINEMKYDLSLQLPPINESLLFLLGAAIV